MTQNCIFVAKENLPIWHWNEARVINKQTFNEQWKKMKSFAPSRPFEKNKNEKWILDLWPQAKLEKLPGFVFWPK